MSAVQDTATSGTGTDTVADPIQTEDTARLYLVIGRLSRSLRRVDAGPSELGHGSVSALATLVNQGSMRLGDLAAKEAVAPPTLSRIVATLVDGGYVRREPDPNDGRAFLVTPTEEGERIMSGLYSKRLQELRRRTDRLTPEQRAALSDALAALEALVAEDDSVNG